MVTIFQNGFEEGNFSQWLGPYVGGVGGTATVVSVRAHSGMYSASFIMAAALAFGEVKVQKKLLSGTGAKIFFREYLYINRGIAEMMTNDRWYPIRMIDAAGGHIMLAGSRQNGSADPNIYWSIWCAGPGTHKFGTHPISSIAKWICVEIHYDKTMQLYELYIDGVLEISWQGPGVPVWPNALVDVDIVEVGMRRTGLSTPPNVADPTGILPIDVNIDDVVIADAYIGPIVTPSLPKITVNSSPELNVPVYVDDQFIGSTPIIVELNAGTHTVRVETEVTR